MGTILEDVGDNTIRLELAAWHRAAGRETWAEFVTLQVDLAVGLHLAECGADTLAPVTQLCRLEKCSYCHARRREWQLLNLLIPGPHPVPVAIGPPVEIRERWYNTVRLAGWEYPDQGGGFVILNRGALEEVRCDLTEWLASAAELMAVCPVHRVSIADVPGLELRVVNREGRWHLDGSITLPKQEGSALAHVRRFQGRPMPSRSALARLAAPLSAEAARGSVELAEAYPA